MRAEEESSILRDVASSEKDMEYFEDGKSRIGVFAIISDLDWILPKYTGSISQERKWSRCSTQ